MTRATHGGGPDARRTGRLSACGALLAAGLLVSGCSGGAPRGDALASGAAGAATGEPAPTAAGPSISKEILYKLLVGEIAGRRGRLDLAVENYLDVARETRDPAVAERAVRIAVFSRDAERGLEAAKLWSEVAPDSVDAKQVYAALLLRAGDLDAAVALLSEIVERLETSPGEGFGRVSDLLARESDKKLAVIAMKRLVAGHPDDPGAQLALAHLLARAGQLEESVEVFERAIELDPENVRAVVFHARILQRLNRLEAALDSLNAFVERRPDATTVRMTLARMLVDARRYEDARSQFERLAADDPDNGDVRYALGLLLVQTNHLDEAREQFRRLVEAGDRREAAWYYLGQIGEAQERVEDALEAYSNVDRGEHRLNAQIRVAVLTAELGDVEAARSHLHALRGGSAPEAIRLYRAEAEILTRRDRFDDAMGVYDSALDEHPEDGDLLYARAMLAEKMDRLDILERDLRDILVREPNNADALNALGYTLADRTERYDEALELIKRAYELKPDDHYIVDSLGWIMYRLGRYDEAIRHLRRAMELNPDGEVAAHLGEVLWVSGDWQGAREVWDAALESTPEDPRILDVKKRFGL